MRDPYFIPATLTNNNNNMKIKFHKENLIHRRDARGWGQVRVIKPTAF